MTNMIHYFKLLVVTTLAIVTCALAGCSERRAENFRKQGDALYSLGRYDEAIPYYARATELAPANARAHSGLGRCYAGTKKFDLAAEQFRAAMTLDATARADHAQNIAILEEAGQHDAAKELARMMGIGLETPSGVAAAAQPGVAAGGESWRALWNKAALHELLDRRGEFQPEEGLPESLLLAALFTSNQPLVMQIGAGLPLESPMRPYYEAIARKDGRAAIRAAEDWNELSDIRKPLRAYAMPPHNNLRM